MTRLLAHTAARPPIHALTGHDVTGILSRSTAGPPMQALTGHDVTGVLSHAVARPPVRLLAGLPGHDVTGVLAHGLGSRHDLPIPLFYAFAGAFAALFVSFLGLALLWADSRFRGGAAGRPVRLPEGARVRWTLRVIGLAGAVFTAAWTLLGPDDPGRNPAAHLVYVILWTGLIPASLLLGPVWRLLNPLRTIHLLLGGRDKGPAPFGYRPAALGLTAFAWMELASPAPASTTTLAVFFTLYGAAHLAAAFRYGTRWFDRADAFEVYSALIGRLSPLGRRDDGRLVLRNPLDGLDALRPAPGLVAVVCVLLGTTGYDGFSDSPWWVELLQTGPLGRTVTGTLGLLAAIGLVAALYRACTAAAGLIGRAGRVGAAAVPVPSGGAVGASGEGRASGRAVPSGGAVGTSGEGRASGGAGATGGRGAARLFAHSLVPVAVGYLIAHYFSLLVIEGQRAVVLSLGLDRTVDPDVVGPGAIASVQVLAIVAGHVLGVVAAHDRSVRLFPPEKAVAGQIPLLVLMVCYTIGGLILLFAA
ncbi:hypothetical protein [Streptosporangium pseudovulgare]|uniref:Fenitrothion hydrolase n=1 Tax=Streptosporangium pseudovulgare TaxID=35765 RepID=A0ABQ2QGR1_9ACTN|nr:hypothetical protein [Streptosporangium pseudovulgare]GGP78489.1 hypothetical protein GCM10010140_03380 [Streptosporangium pseudovulgare]